MMRAENSGKRFKPPGRCPMRYPNALRLCLISCLCALVPIVLVQAPGFAQDTVRIAYIDPLSGGGASIGEVGAKTFQFMADEINAKGGVLGKKIEIVPYDNKLNPQESLVQIQKPIDSGIRLVTPGHPSPAPPTLPTLPPHDNH